MRAHSHTYIPREQLNGLPCYTNMERAKSTKLFLPVRFTTRFRAERVSLLHAQTARVSSARGAHTSSHSLCCTSRYVCEREMYVYAHKGRERAARIFEDVENGGRGRNGGTHAGH